MHMPISFAPLRIIASISRGVTNILSCSLPESKDAPITVGIPTEMTGTPRVAEDSSNR